MKGSQKAVRNAFAKLVQEKGISQEDLETFRRVGELMAKAQQQAETDDCSGVGDKCLPGSDCGYQEGGCGNDEHCRVCDSCMVMWDTCSSKMTGEDS